MMLRFLFFYFFLFLFSLSAQTIDAKFVVQFGIVGDVAKVNVLFEKEASRYKLDATLYTVGKIARMATDNLKERHISKGSVKAGLLITHMYQMIKTFGKYKSNTVYTINHKTKEVHRLYQKWKNGKRIVNQKLILGYYAKDDLMTLFLNLSQYIKKKNHPKTYQFSVAGADRKQGRVDVRIPTKKRVKKIKSLIGGLDPDSWYSTVIMHRKLYGSKKGELDIRIGKDTFLEKAVLKDLIFFGDVRIIRQ